MRDELAPVLRASASVSAIVPARNEAAVVGRALESLSRQQFSGRLQIVVVDDDSEDATAEIALRYATVIRGTSLAEGWTGKLWALSQGIAHGGAPDYFLLTDADVVHAPENLAGLVARAEGEGYDLVSYMAELRCQSLAERALIPAFVWRRGVADDVLRVFAGGSLLPPKPAVGASAARHCGLLYGMHGGVGDTVLARCWGKLEGTSAGGAIAQ
jgi:glycosyltransferase involved in cell wall biosynthesis